MVTNASAVSGPTPGTVIKPMTHLMAAGAPHQLAFECCDLVVDGAPNRQQGLDHQPQLGVVREAGAHLGLEPGAAAFWQDQTEDLHQTAAAAGATWPRACATRCRW